MGFITPVKTGLIPQERCLTITLLSVNSVHFCHFYQEVEEVLKEVLSSFRHF